MSVQWNFCEVGALVMDLLFSVVRAGRLPHHAACAAPAGPASPEKHPD